MAHVLDLTNLTAAYAARLLVEAGHTVVRVESRRGDGLRRQGPFLGDAPDLENGAYHQFLNAGKFSLTLELDSFEGQAILLDLVRATDALVACLPLPLDEAILLAANPRLVLTLVEDDGPEICAAARSGLAFLTGQPERAPVVLGGHVFSAAVGLYAATATSVALYIQHLRSQGQVVRVSVRQCLESLAEQALIEYQTTGRITERIGYRGAVTAISGAFPCADGYWMLSVPPNAEGWARFAAWVGDPVLLADPTLADEAERRARQDSVLERVEAWSRPQSKDALVAEAQRRHIPAAPVASALDLVDDPQLVARGFLAPVEHPRFGRGLIPRGAVGTILGTEIGPAPRLGEHNAELLDALGYSAADDEVLVESGTV